MPTMIYPKPHVKEVQRIQALEAYAILDSPKEQAYDDITALAAKISEVPIALVSLLDETRQWFKSNFGLEVRETPKEFAFCAHAINSTDDIFVVPDSRTDSRFVNNPLVIGEPHVIFYAGVPLLSDDNLPLGTLCIIDNKPRSISQHEVHSLKLLANQVMLLLKHRKHQKELAESIVNLSKKNKDLEQFAYVIAHDLKSPLINISSVSKFLTENYGPDLDEDGKTMMSLIQSSSDKLNDYIDDILKYYKNENAIQEEISSINLKEFYSQIFEVFNHDRSVKFNLKTSLEQINSNSSILFQIMINLISNAIRYNDKNNVAIEIGTFENSKFYEFYLEDNGPGIPKQLQEKVFELFMVGQKFDKYGKKGNGIGLANVKKLVEHLGGSIALENGKENGCKFVFRLKK